jgi:hypothetical protein
MMSRLDWLGMQGSHIRITKYSQRRGSLPRRGGCTATSEHVSPSFSSKPQAGGTGFCINGPMYIIAAQLSTLAAALLPFLQLTLSKGG